MVADTSQAKKVICHHSEKNKKPTTYGAYIASSDQNILNYTEGARTLDLETLRSHLWEAADILRGSIDVADYKNYIFGLLFLKRINDRVDAETVQGDRNRHEEF